MGRRPLGVCCLAVTAFLFVLVHIKPVPFTDYSVFQKKNVTVMGRVYRKEIREQKAKESLVLYLKLFSPGKDDAVQAADTGPPGERVICYLRAGEQEPEIGSVVQLKGKMACFERASNPGQFDAYSYYQISGISYRLNQAIVLAKTTKYNGFMEGVYRLRRLLSHVLEENLPEKEASVMQTILLGEKEGLDRDLKALYQRNGIVHILAISGLHISMLGMGLYKLLRKCGVPMNLAAAVSMALMVFYCVMTGFSVSAVRAVLMFCLQMAAVLAKRTYDMLTALGIAAVLILLSQPLYLYHSGFVFSFGCVLGIGLVLPSLIEEGEFVKKPVIKEIAGGLGVVVITLPIYLWFYYQFPVYSVVLNLLVIPLMSFLMGAGLFVLALGILWPFGVMPFRFVIKIILMLYEGACGGCDNLPGRLLTTGRPAVWQVVVYVMVLVFLVMYKKKLHMAVKWGIVAVAVVILTLHPRAGLKVIFLDVGQGDSIYIENEGRSSYLVDGGSSSVSSVGLYRIIPFLKSQGVSELEAVFVTHPDEDHCNGIMELLKEGALQGIKVKHLVLPDIAKEGRGGSYKELEQAAGAAGIVVSYISRGQKISDGRLMLTCLHPSRGYQAGDANAYSIVLELTYGNFIAMLTGDVEGEGEQEMVGFWQEEQETDKITVLKAAHHGSRNSTPEDFLDCTSPIYTVISCGENNSYGHPHRELMERLGKQETKILITYETGAVTFTTDGRKVKLRKFLNE